jgi:hypothetical protein
MTIAASQNGRMRRWRKEFAWVVLAATLVPWPVAVAVAVHEASEHGAADAAVHNDLAAVLHGHEHDSGTPDHDHSLTPSGPVASEQLRLFVMRTPRLETAAVTASPSRDRALGEAPQETASPPAGSKSSKRILRI